MAFRERERGAFFSFFVFVSLSTPLLSFLFFYSIRGSVSVVTTREKSSGEKANLSRIRKGGRGLSPAAADDLKQSGARGGGRCGSRENDGGGGPFPAALGRRRRRRLRR